MTLKIQNTLTNKKEEFVPIEKGKVKMYVCGVTVYDDIHMGHARSIIVFDVVSRYLRYLGYDVTFVTNFTDVDDKIINRANERGIEALALSKEYIEKYFRDIESLGVRRADIYPQASTSMPYIIDMVRDIIDKGYGYATKDGSVYFRVRKIPDYGQLSNRTLDEMRSSGRVDLDPDKEDPMDFAVWKGVKPGEVSWESPWGEGRPGWHIECSAMIRHYLGDVIDIHGGGNDLIFPHHENEILQTEAVTGTHLANYWMHNGMLETKGADGKAVKMSKSLKNFFKVEDVAKKFDKYTIRFYYLNTHYRSPLTYGEENMLEAQAALRRLWNNYRDLQAAARDGASGSADCISRDIEEARRGFRESMDDDFNTRAAIEALFAFARTTNRMMGEKTLTKEGAQAAIAFMDEINDVLGILPENEGSSDDGSFNEVMQILIDLRKELRTKKQYELADMIRDRLKDAGYVIEDSSEGAKWKKI
ncbi:cysteinyl-tRNA synthetase [Thermoplasmatales archaeon BRNA1]|nr:cysteinyl-tRNA synthetase [Thermoplasmatales archaeon BRNA1]